MAGHSHRRMLKVPFWLSGLVMYHRNHVQSSRLVRMPRVHFHLCGERKEKDASKAKTRMEGFGHSQCAQARMHCAWVACVLEKGERVHVMTRGKLEEANT